MTAGAQPERRRWPRVQVLRVDCHLHIRARVRLLDLSGAGALLASEVPFPVGARGQLRFALDGTAFSPVVQIRRWAGRQGREVLLGSSFGSMDDRSRQRLEDFFRRAAP